MMAPSASFSTYSGSYRGSVIAASWSGGFQVSLFMCLFKKKKKKQIKLGKEEKSF
jgi:hypothetical protein